MRSSSINLDIHGMWIDISFLAVLGFFLIGSAHSAQLGKSPTRRGLAIAFYAMLMVWIIAVMQMHTFLGSETSLIGYFVLGLAVLITGQFLQARSGKFARWAQATVPLAALAFALGFDPLRPDAYSYVPAAILGLMVGLVGVAAHIRLSKAKKGPKAEHEVGLRLSLPLYILCVAILVYSASYKMMDRGWQAPWAYLATGGGLLFATSQLWFGWEKILRDKRSDEWAREAILNLGILLMVVAALFVYRQFL